MKKKKNVVSYTWEKKALVYFMNINYGKLVFKYFKNI